MRQATHLDGASPPQAHIRQRRAEAASSEMVLSSSSSPRGSSGGRRKIPNRINIACIKCRRRHVRCDGQKPRCSRCRQMGKGCVYQDIRRRRRRMPSTGSDQDDTFQTTTASPGDAGTVSVHPRFSQSSSTAVQCSLDDTDEHAFDVFLDESGDARQSTALDAFYSSFFKGHPFVLPRPCLLEKMDESPALVADVVKAMTFIGSLYARDVCSGSYRAALEAVVAQGLAQNGFSVQCLMLFAGALEWSGEQDRARTVLDDASSLALRLGMNVASFADNHSSGCPVLAESWRRTWWELYIIDGIFAGIRHAPAFELWRVMVTVDLPCEETDYVSGSIPRPRTQAEYHDRAFEDSVAPFSSFTYLIDGARILGSTLQTVEKTDDDVLSVVKNAEANITSWHLYLPESKKEPVQSDGCIDEVLFRAHMLLYTVTTHLHRPRSRLHFSIMEILCSKYAPPRQSTSPTIQQSNERHTFQAIKAAGACVELFTLSTSPTSHSPFIMCMGSMAAAAHISACQYHLDGPEYQHAKDLVRVFLGTLGAFEGIWPQARKWSSEIRLMARAVFESREQGDVLGHLEQGIPGLDLAMLRSCF